jgi:hypothetical protein
VDAAPSFVCVPGTVTTGTVDPAARTAYRLTMSQFATVVVSAGVVSDDVNDVTFVTLTSSPVI